MRFRRLKPSSSLDKRLHANGDDKRIKPWLMWKHFLRRSDIFGGTCDRQNDQMLLHIYFWEAHQRPPPLSPGNLRGWDASWSSCTSFDFDSWSSSKTVKLIFDSLIWGQVWCGAGSRYSQGLCRQHFGSAVSVWLNCIFGFFYFFIKTWKETITVMEPTENKRLKKLFCQVERENPSSELHFSGSNG